MDVGLPDSFAPKVKEMCVLLIKDNEDNAQFIRDTLAQTKGEHVLHELR